MSPKKEKERIKIERKKELNKIKRKKEQNKNRKKGREGGKVNLQQKARKEKQRKYKT